MSKRNVNVAMIGYDFMGRTHSNAWRQVSRFFKNLPFTPVLKVVVGRTESRVNEAKEQLGFEEAATSWEEVVALQGHRHRRHLHAGRFARTHPLSRQLRQAKQSCVRNR